MAFGCCSILLRASFLGTALPLLLVGSLFSEVALRLQLETVKQLEYAAAEGASSASLQAEAGATASEAIEQHTEGLELEREAATLQGVSVDEEQGTLEARSDDAGFQLEEPPATEAAGNIQDAVDAASEEAAGSDLSVDAAVEGTSAAAGEAGAAEAAMEASEAGAEAAAGALEGDASVLGGPLGIAITAGALTAAQEAPKVLAAGEGLASELQADKDEVVAIERFAQAGALEADTLVEMDGAAAADSAAAKSLAIAGTYFASAQLFQTLAFAFEAPVAMVVIAQWTVGAGATLYGLRQCESSSTGAACGSIVSTVSLAGALGSLLLGPWATTVLYAAELESGDPALRALEGLPKLIEKATQNRSHSTPVREQLLGKDRAKESAHAALISKARRSTNGAEHKGKAHRDQVPKSKELSTAEKRKLGALDWLTKAADAAGNLETTVSNATNNALKKQQTPTAAVPAVAVPTVAVPAVTAAAAAPIANASQQASQVAQQTTASAVAAVTAVANSKLTSQVGGAVQQEGKAATTSAASILSQGIQEGAAQLANATAKGQHFLEQAQRNQQVQAAEGSIASGIQKGTSELSNWTSKIAHSKAVGAAATGTQKEATELGQVASQEVSNISSQVAGKVNVGSLVPGGVRDGLSHAVNATESAKMQLGEAVGQAKEIVSEHVPDRVKQKEKEAEQALKKQEKEAADDARSAEKAAIRLKNGSPDVQTTTVAPRKPKESPEAASIGSKLKPAAQGVWARICHWAQPVLNCILLVSIAFALTELAIATGRHLPSYREQCANGPAYMGRVLSDAWGQWIGGFAVLVALWIMSIILAPVLRDTAQKVHKHVEGGTWPVTKAQITFCIFCLLTSSARGLLMARKKCTCDQCNAKDAPGTGEEKTPLKQEESPRSRSDSEPPSDIEQQKTEAVTAARAGLLCTALTAGIEAILLAMERPVTAWALGGSYKSFLATRLLVGMIPWSIMAPTIWGYTPSSPYELMVPVGAVAFAVGGMLVFAKRKAL